MQSYNYKIGKWFANFSTNTLFDEQGHEVHVEPKAMELLRVLVEANGELVDRSKLMTSVWGGRFVTDYALNSTIASLRKYLNPEDRESYIVTRPKRGYQIVAAIIPSSIVSEAEKQNSTATQAPSNLETATIQHGNTLALISNKWFYFALFAVIVLVSFYMSKANLNAQLQEAPLPKSLAVLPFDFDKNNNDIAYIAFGLPGELIKMVSEQQSFDVRDRRSSFDLAKTQRDVKSVADQLKVSFVFDGSVKQGDSAEEYIVSWSLFNELGTTIQSGQNLINDNNIIDVQNQIASTIIQAIGDDTAKVAVDYGDTDNTLAYMQLLKGRQQNQYATLDAHLKALDHFKMALALDPDYTMAMVDLSIAYMLLVSQKHISLEDANAAAKPLLERALTLNPEMPSAIAAKGIYALHNNQNTLARDYFLEALDRDPNLYVARVNLAYLYRNRGFWEDALKHYKIAKQLSPISPTVVQSIARMHFQLGQLKESLEQLEYCISFEVMSDSCHLELAYLQRLQGHAEKAEATFQTVLDRKKENINYNLRLNIAFHAKWTNDTETYSAFYEGLHDELGIDIYEPDSYVTLKWSKGENENYYKQVKPELDSRIEAKKVNQKQIRGLGYLAYSVGDCRASIDYYEYAFSNDARRSYTGFSEWAEGHSPTLFMAACYQRLGESDNAEMLINMVEDELAKIGPLAREMPGIMLLQHKVNLLNNPKYQDDELKQKLVSLNYPFVWLLEKDWFYSQKRFY
ncbi:winged helix-turn-helix domain-containing protein [Glaciecola sp. MH2013]|uniref:winged helix-turn-helix domain-containing tetratricopeptide repeat protein n=1 Tax=Glaciecola sp. MH2013 TaxID=2785524 RepID=UPI00189EA40B|nr:winged helix-turn-helix domain-containing protein [Glaciecola sp. MH2013]MBF7073321.1 winged helix-turn-helix domain-containing protein [Glaciecola sp. MH2013]